MTSRKDQEQYWADENKPYHYLSVSELAEKFRKFHVGHQLETKLSIPFDKSHSHRAALVFSKNSVPSLELLKASFAREWLLIKRNSFVYIFKTVQVSYEVILFYLTRYQSKTRSSPFIAQIIIVAVFASTMFPRSRMHTNNEEDGTIYVGALVFGIVTNLFNGMSELPFALARLPVFYKHRDHLFYPVWVYTLPNIVFRIPISLLESLIWVVMTYYSIGFSPEASR